MTPAKTLDTAVYNLLKKEWVREGRKLDPKQASNRLNYRRRMNPDAQFKIVEVPRG